MSVAPRLDRVCGELSDLVEALWRRWVEGPRRMTKKRAEVATLLVLYREVQLILERIREELPGIGGLARFMQSPVVSGIPHSPGPPAVDATLIGNVATASLNVDLKSLYHWAYTIELFLEHSSAKGKIDLTELKRIGIFRHKLIVHHAQTPLRQRNHFATWAHSWGPDVEDFRIVSYPIAAGASVWAGNRRRLARFNRYVPGLNAESNLWAKADLLYRHLNSVPDGPDKRWATGVLFATVGLRSDPAVVLARAFLTALGQYATITKA